MDSVGSQKGRGRVKTERSSDGSLLFQTAATVGPATFLDLVDGLDKEGLT